MSTTRAREIIRDEWVSFFTEFSQRHARWLVTMEMLGPELGAQIEGRSVRFEGINADLKDGENVVTIDLGESADNRLTHAIRHPRRIWVGQCETAKGTFETLDIEAEDGTKTLVRFLAGVVPEEIGAPA